ncbi:phosphate-induced protein 1 [Phycomyces nitens]|nr:phosphate-induced protein 1 [Phycomyces nitens]
MKFISTAVSLLFSAILVAAQQDAPTTTPTAASTPNLTPLATKYGDSFKNAGGKMLIDKVNVYLIFYGDWSSPEAQNDQSVFMSFVDRLSSTSWFSTLKQYPNADGKTIGGPLSLAAAVTDSGSHGLNLTDTNTHKQIVTDAVHSGYLDATNQLDNDGFYIILAAKNVQDSDFCNTHCGYNGYSDEFQYMYIGYPGSCTDSCVPGFNQVDSPNNSTSIDAAITIFSHEVQDILTDPRDDAWILKDGDTKVEVGDFCSGQGVTESQWFGATSQVEGRNASYNLAIDDKKYLVQTIYSPKSKTCVLSSE